MCCVNKGKGCVEGGLHTMIKGELSARVCCMIRCVVCE